MESILKKYFGYSLFRPYQKEIIAKILDRRDSLVVMATGSGKSLCYQIPPLITGKTAIVVSPLLSLMQDQVMSLKQRGIKAEYLGSTQTNSSTQSNAESGLFDILYMTPEKACSLSHMFWSNLLKLGICLFAIDEAHCISEWGHAFRKEYKQLDKLRGFLSDVPFVALTATATEKVRLDIIHSLKMNDPYVAVGSFDRPNLFYGVKSLNRSVSFLDELVGEVSIYVASGGSTIIYCTTINDTEKIFESFQHAGIKAGLYHGKMSSKAREESHRLFIRDEVPVMVATIAFGMGIDKPNIRCVIHYGCPKSLESYYQESGRCGRDGLASICWLYYTRSDFTKADFYCGEAHTENQRKAIMESLMAAQKYCVLTTCRRKFLLDHFGEKTTSTNCGDCDNCRSTKQERDVSREAFLLLKCIQSCQGRWGLNMPVDILRGSRSKRIRDNNFDKLELHGLGKENSATWWKSLADQLMAKGYLMESVRDLYRTVSVSSTGVQFLLAAGTTHPPPLILQVTSEMVDEEHNSQVTGVERGIQSFSSLQCEGFSEVEVKLYHMLMDMRMELANSNGTAPYAICGDQTIKKITRIRPSTKARLANIDGVNQHLVNRYGDHILQNISRLTQELKLPLDGGEGIVETTAVKGKACLNSNSQRKLTPAKYEAWKMWQEDRLSVQRIANLPERAAPVKEQTVLEYILEAAREGCDMNWDRFCEEIGLTYNIFLEIQGAIAKIGSRERLKPLKDEVAENINYQHIKACITMLDLGVPTEDITSFQSSNVGGIAAIKITGLSRLPDHVGSHKDASSIQDPMSISSSTNHDQLSLPDTLVTGAKRTQGAVSTIQQSPAKKFHKGNEPVESGSRLEATETEILKLLGGDGASLSDIVEHFKGSEKENVIGLLSKLEAEFFIFRKNGLYIAM